MKKLILILYLLPFSLMGQNYPTLDNDNQFVKHNGFVLSYNETCEQPNWVQYTLTPNDILDNDVVKRKNYFKLDKLVKTGSASSSDYGKPYDRGHLKPSADESNNQIQMNETFYMSNISPQHYSFNRGVWKRLESRVRSITNNSDSIIVTVGPILNDTLPRIGDNNVCVPEYFFKVLKIYKNGKYEYQCYYMKNEKSYEALNKFSVTLDVLEKKTQIKF